MRCFLFCTITAAAWLAGGCGMGGVLSTPTSYEKKVGAEFNIAQYVQGKTAVVVQGGPESEVRRKFTDILLRELESKAGVKKNRLVPAGEIDKLRQDEDKYLAMTSAQVGGAVGAEVVLVAKIINYGLYPLPLGSYHDCSMTVSAVLVDVRSGTILWPQDGMERQVSIAMEAVSGDAEAAGDRMMSVGAHGIVRYLYDCQKAYFRIPGEKRGNEWDDY